MRLWALAVVSAVVLAACSNGGTGSPSPHGQGPPWNQIIVAPRDFGPAPSPLHVDAEDIDAAAFRGVVGWWELASFPGETFDGTPYIHFSHLQTWRKQRLSYGYGYGGICNGHSGEYLVDGDQMRLSATSSTLMGCVGDINRQEIVFGGFVHSVERWSRDGDVLTLMTSDGTAAVFRPMHPRWVRFDEAELVETVTPRVHFVDETGFLLGLQEQESADGIHAEEKVNWVAWERGFHGVATDGFAWESGHYETEDTWVDGPDAPTPSRPTRVTFRQSYESPCLVGGLNTLHGTDTAALSARQVGDQGVSLVVEEETSSGAETGHVDEVVGLLVAECGVFDAGVEFGRVEPVWDRSGDPTWPVFVSPGLTSAWRRVEIGGAFVDPVVVAGPSTQHGSDRGVVEVRNVTPTSFEIRFHEWDYLDGDHPTQESVSYLVVERGVTVLPSGVRIEAGTASTTSALSEVQFNDTFDANPVLLATVLR